MYGHGALNKDTSRLFCESENMRNNSKIRIVCRKSKCMRRFILSNLNGVGSVFLDGHLTARRVFLAYSNWAGRECFDLEFATTPFGVTGKIGDIIEGFLQWSIDEHLMGTHKSGHKIFSFPRVIRVLSFLNVETESRLAMDMDAPENSLRLALLNHGLGNQAQGYRPSAMFEYRTPILRLR
jgi:hypothetical protein